MHNLIASFPESKPKPVAEELPVDFDPVANPILAEHFFGIPPADLRLQRQAESLHALGPRPIFEFCRELAEAHGIGADIQRRLAKYARLDSAVVRAVGADRFPPAVFAVANT